MMQVVGRVSERVDALLGISISSDRTIYIGESNLAHMKASHPADFAKYCAYIEDILKCPDYIGKNPKDGSIEYVKQFSVDGEYVKVAVRVSSSNRFYARSLYVLNENRVSNFIRKGTLISFHS